MEMKLEKKVGRYVVCERGLLRSYAGALEGPTCGSSDDLSEALGMLDAVLRARKGPSARSARKGGPRSRCATRKRSLGVAFPARSAHAARVPRTAAFDRLLMAAIIPPCRAPRALAAGFQTLPQGRLRKPSAHHPDGLARYALRRTNRRSYGLPVAMILPCARRRGRANRSLRLAPAG